MFSSKNNQRAFSLIELLVAISLFAVLLTLSFPALRTGIETAKLLNAVAESSSSSDYLFAQIKRVSLQQDRHLGTELLKIAPSSILPNRLNSRSNVLLLIDISLERAMSRNKQTSGAKFCALFSLDSAERTRVENSKVYLLHTSDGVSLAPITATKSGTNPCREYFLSPTSFSLNTPEPTFFLFEPNREYLNRAAIAIPAVDIYGYYLDNQQTLRRYSFISGQSQPLFKDISAFVLNEVQHKAGKVLEVTINVGDRRQQESFFVPNVTPFDYLNLFSL